MVISYLSGYIDEHHLQGKTKQNYIANVIAAITLFENLGLVIHPEEVSYSPTTATCFPVFYNTFRPNDS